MEPARAHDLPERLTWVEIRARYPDQWVTLVDADWIDEDANELRTAVVVLHSEAYAESWPPAGAVRDGQVLVHEYTGTVSALR